MAFYMFGDYIREQRERMGVTQEDLCEGICSPGTLSKIENGRQGVRLNQYIALMERLGLPVQPMGVQVTEEEMRWHRVKSKIQYTTALGNWNIEEELEQLEHIKKNRTKEDKQFILFNRAVVNMKQGESIDNVISMLLEAMRITCPRFDIDRTASVKLLTMDEILIISNIATALKAKGNLMQAIKWEYFLKEYMENERLEYDGVGRIYPLVLFDLSNCLGECNRFEEALELCDIGIAYCNEHGKLNAYTELIYNKSRYLFKLKRDDEAKRYMLYTYCVATVRNHEKIKDIAKKCLDDLGIDTVI